MAWRYETVFALRQCNVVSVGCRGALLPNLLLCLILTVKYLRMGRLEAGVGVVWRLEVLEPRLF